MFELRWYVRPGWDGPERVLQYRCKVERTDYGSSDPTTGGFLRVQGWTDWFDVPEVVA